MIGVFYFFFFYSSPGHIFILAAQMFGSIISFYACQHCPLKEMLSCGMALWSWKWIHFPSLFFIFTVFFFNVACGWLSLSSVGLSSTTFIRRLVTFYENKTLKKIRMKGSVWCHLSFSIGRTQVCLKYFARLFHNTSSFRCAVWWNSFVKEAFISSDGRGPHRSGSQTMLWLAFFHSFFSFTPNDCEVIIFYFRNNLETWI